MRRHRYCYESYCAGFSLVLGLLLADELDMLREQRSRHEVILFKDETGIITGMAIDEFPDAELRAQPDPDV